MVQQIQATVTHTWQPRFHHQNPHKDARREQTL